MEVELPQTLHRAIQISKEFSVVKTQRQRRHSVENVFISGFLFVHTKEVLRTRKLQSGILHECRVRSVGGMG